MKKITKNISFTTKKTFPYSKRSKGTSFVNYFESVLTKKLKCDKIFAVFDYDHIYRGVAQFGEKHLAPPGADEARGFEWQQLGVCRVSLRTRANTASCNRESA